MNRRFTACLLPAVLLGAALLPPAARGQQKKPAAAKPAVAKPAARPPAAPSPAATKPPFPGEWYITQLTTIRKDNTYSSRTGGSIEFFPNGLYTMKYRVSGTGYVYTRFAGAYRWVGNKLYMKQSDKADAGEMVMIPTRGSGEQAHTYTLTQLYGAGESDVYLLEPKSTEGGAAR
jgi:hypothetical protein